MASTGPSVLTVSNIIFQRRDGRPVSNRDRMHIALLRLAGCRCELPLLGSRPRQAVRADGMPKMILGAVRCRACGAEVELLP